MKKAKTILFFVAFICLLVMISSFRQAHEDWGFFGHRKINRYAVFTLPEEMLPLYKQYIDYLEEHAVDPDKRRYATKFEAIRHYIDLDQWGSYPFESLPKRFNEALASHSKLVFIQNADSIQLSRTIEEDSVFLSKGKDLFLALDKKQYFGFFQKFIIPIYYEDEWKVAFNKEVKLGKIEDGALLVIDTFSTHGILPYYLPMALNKLTKAFEQGNVQDIIRHSADIGHYIGDAHVPLHTTKNYNGQLTNQLGIHAFWESRLPELFSEAEYDFFAGKADYIDRPDQFFWKIIFDSHRHLDAVLGLEKKLSQDFPSDQQFCYDERLGQTVRIQCEDYAKVYHEGLQGMVEERMVSSIRAIGSIWYTAWINAGQPDLKKLMNPTNDIKIIPEEIKVDPTVNAREHGE